MRSNTSAFHRTIFGTKPHMAASILLLCGPVQGILSHEDWNSVMVAQVRLDPSTWQWGCCEAADAVLQGMEERIGSTTELNWTELNWTELKAEIGLKVCRNSRIRWTTLSWPTVLRFNRQLHKLLLSGHRTFAVIPVFWYYPPALSYQRAVKRFGIWSLLFTSTKSSFKPWRRPLWLRYRYPSC